MFSIFPSFVESYVCTCNQNRHRDGTPLLDPQNHNKGVFQFGKILEKIQRLARTLCVDDDDSDGDDDDDDDGGSSSDEDADGGGHK